MKCLLLIVFMGLQVATASYGPSINDFVKTTLRFGDSECGCFPKAMTALTEVTYKKVDNAKNPDIKLYGRLFTDAYRGRVRVDFATVPFRQAKGSYSNYVILDIFADLKAGVLNVKHKGQPGGKCKNLKFGPISKYNMSDHRRCFLRRMTKKEEYVTTKQSIVSSTFRFIPSSFIDMNFTYAECCKLSSFTIRNGQPGLGYSGEAFFKGEVVSLDIFDMIRRVKPFCTEPQQNVGSLMENLSILRILELLDQGETDGELIASDVNLPPAPRK
ncbi:uncharacterized protein LOC141909292 isoform X2 [Tubulanus polymorphus]